MCFPVAVCSLLLRRDASHFCLICLLYTSIGFETLFKGAGSLLGNMGKDALDGLSAAFGQSGKMAADYHAARRRDSEETARQEGENAAKGADHGPLLEANLRRYADYYACLLYTSAVTAPVMLDIPVREDLPEVFPVPHANLPNVGLW